MFRKLFGALAVSAAIFCCSPADADVVYNLTFKNFGTTVEGTGTLTLNFASTQAAQNIGNPSGTSLAPFLVSIITSDLNGHGAFSITPANLVSSGPNASLFQTGAQAQIFTLTAAQSGSGAQSVLFLDLFTNSWQLRNGSNTGGTADQGSFTITGPTVVATPLPGALSLFAGGAALLGYLGLRRKRKVLAAA